MISLQRQLRRNMLITLLLAMAAMLVLVDFGVRRIAMDYVVSRLQHDAESIIVSLAQNDDGQWTLDPGHLAAVYNRVHSGHYYRIVGAHTDLRSRSLWDFTPTLPSLSAGQNRTQLELIEEQEKWLTWSQGVSRNGDTLVIWVAEDVSGLTHCLPAVSCCPRF